MILRNARRSDNEWLALITEARQSGLTDKQLCEAHGISRNTFYTAVDRLRKKACAIPEPQRKRVVDFTAPKNEVVKVGILDEIPKELVVDDYPKQIEPPAIELCFSNCKIHVSNSAAPALVASLMSSLRDML